MQKKTKFQNHAKANDTGRLTETNLDDHRDNEHYQSAFGHDVCPGAEHSLKDELKSRLKL